MTRLRGVRPLLLVLLTLVLRLLPLPALALEPDEVLVVANQSARGSVALASYYLGRRSIPEANLLRIRTTDEETCSRQEYDEQIARPVRARLLAEGGKAIRAVVLMRGVPLRVLPSEPSAEEKWSLARLVLEERDLLGQRREPTLSESERARTEKRVGEIRSEMEAIRHADEEASVDSELALVTLAPYALKGWIPNPLYLGATQTSPGVRPEAILRVSRLDGPSESTVRRMIDDSLSAERDGLRGNAYFDARWKDPGEGKPLSGYALWDRSIHRAASSLRKTGMTVVVDANEALFPEGSRLPAALYCGWYSLSHYVAAFEWQRGAVAYHIASGECTTLRVGDSQAWCKRMLEEGVAATLGPVSEPYVQAFPPPHLFMELLAEAHLPLVEAYTLTLPYLSWKMVLVGDPLYRPFARGR